MTDREAYTRRLILRINDMMVRDNLTPRSWEEVAQVDQVLVEAAFAYEAGEIDKDELDSKAIGYLHEVRRVAQ